MQLTLIQTHTSPVVDEFADKPAELNLLRYASEAVKEMEFDSLEEMHESVKRAMKLCLAAGVPIKGNFRRVYKSFADGIMYDWKLSLLAYKLVCISGKYSNPNVAFMNIQLIKNEHLNHF